MVDLNSFAFTKDSDVVEVFDEPIFNDTLVRTLSGDDSITSDINSSSSQFSIAINNEGIIQTGRGDDSISVNFFGGNILNTGKIKMGSGHDSINSDEIINNGIIDMGTGNDSIQSNTNDLILNNGIIQTGKGDDSIRSRDTDALIGIVNNGIIGMGQGNDSLDAGGFNSGITNNGRINMGAGNDSFSGSGINSAIINNGRIDMGAGNDSLFASSKFGGITNNGTINMGAGNDVIESTVFDGAGLINLGTGNDVIVVVNISFSGNPIIEGGAGFDKAELIFNSDTVEVETISDNTLALKSGNNEITFTNIELFEFRDFTFSFDELSTFTTLDFDEGNLAAGTVITDQFNGINISTPSEFGVMIFDTGNPTGGDDDLSSSVGNALIISEDGDSFDPDDNAGGGTINIEFDKLATVTSIDFLDIEETGGSINLFADDSSIIEVIEIEPLGDGRLQQLNINVEGVASMDINLSGSGALTQIDFFETIYDDGIIENSRF